ncbi:hypothetical protein [Algoriphagus namhaensis]
MSKRLSPIFEIFEKQHTEAKAIFLELIKRMKSKKAIELLGKISFLELFSELMSSVHAGNEELQQDLFADFRPLQKNLRKIYHHKLVEISLEERRKQTGKNFNRFSKQLDQYKKELYTKTYDQIVGSTFEHWSEFYDMALASSKGLKPLMLNSGVNRQMQQELEVFHLDQNGVLGTQKLKEIYYSIRRIIILENILVQLGFNSIFPQETHDEINDLKDKLKVWYKNHLTLQALSYLLSSEQEPSDKYVQWAKDLSRQKKSLSSAAEQQAKTVFEKLLV